MEYVIKRNNTEVVFNPDKIVYAILRAMDSDINDEESLKTATKIKNRVLRKLKDWKTVKPHVDQIHTLVEHSLMDAKLYDIAREYITYRDANKPDIFRYRANIKPYEYPELMEYVTAIRHSYWIHTEFNYDSDIQDIKVHMNEKEREAVIRSMLAISQIENAVKKFWGRIGDKLPKPEITDVGDTFAESEVRHKDAYSELLEKLGLNDRFTDLKNVPCIDKRIKYLEKVNKNSKATDNKDFFETIILFSMFIENVSLFSQFIIMMSFKKHDNKLKGIANAVSATSKEENIHAMFGFDLVNIIKRENPDWFDDELVDYIKEIAYQAYDAEKEVVEWIYEKGDLTIIPKAVTLEYVKLRLNQSLVAIGCKAIFGLDESLIEQTEWFTDEISVTKNTDFFNTRNTSYTKRSKSITEDDLF